MNFMYSSASSGDTESVLPAFRQTMRPNPCLATRSVAATPKRRPRMRSKGVGEPPRRTWPSTVTAISLVEHFAKRVAEGTGDTAAHGPHEAVQAVENTDDSHAMFVNRSTNHGSLDRIAARRTTSPVDNANSSYRFHKTPAKRTKNCTRGMADVTQRIRIVLGNKANRGKVGPWGEPR